MVAFVSTLYEGDDGTLYQIRLTPDYAAAAGTAPTGTDVSDINVKVSKSNREFGIRPRRVRLARTVGTAPDTFRKYATLPILRATEFATAAYNKGATVTVGGVDYTVVGRQGEDF